jgi:signal recognition particle receptor subunit beta
MAHIDFKERQVTLKLVYYGPPRSGKTTNLRVLHGHVDEQGRGRLVTLDTRDDRTLFFDLLPIFFRTSGLSFRVKVYTVPGQPMHEATRRVVLRAADGVAFVADSRASEVAENRAAYRNLLENLERVGLEIRHVPIVVQYNKRDLDGVIAEADLDPLGDHPVFSAVATSGRGVIDTFLGLIERTWVSLDQDLGIGRRFGIEAEPFLASVRAHLGERARTHDDQA